MKILKIAGYYPWEAFIFDYFSRWNTRTGRGIPMPCTNFNCGPGLCRACLGKRRASTDFMGQFVTHAENALSRGDIATKGAYGKITVLMKVVSYYARVCSISWPRSDKRAVDAHILRGGQIRNTECPLWRWRAWSAAHNATKIQSWARTWMQRRRWNAHREYRPGAAGAAKALAHFRSLC
jgi:hypothetical protein